MTEPELPPTFTCVICNFDFTGYGHNPWPVHKGDDDRCCTQCNAMSVIPARIKIMHEVERLT